MVHTLLYLTISPSIYRMTLPNLLPEAQQQEQAFGVPIWIWFLLIVLVIVVAVIWTLHEESEAGKTQDEATVQAVAEPTQAVTTESAPASDVRPDNLKKVNGIGPKIEQLLKRNSIMTFAQLAETDVSRLQALLDEVEYALADPTTWPEQARNLI